MDKAFRRSAVNLPTALLLALSIAGGCMAAKNESSNSYDALLALFAEWREYERPPTIDSIPISLARWEMTGLGDDIVDITK
jgi:hypothetical protein